MDLVPGQIAVSEPLRLVVQMTTELSFPPL